MSLLRPRYVALDSSHLGDLARDRASKDVERRRKAAAFQARFDDGGCVLLVYWHHMQELLSHDDEGTVNARIAFLRSLPMLAVIRSMTEESLPGSVIDLQAREVHAAFAHPSADPAGIREAAAREMIRLDSGGNIIRPFDEARPVLKAELRRQNDRVREIVAISRSGFTGMEHVRVLDMLNGALRAPEEARRRLQELREDLSRDMRDRGDRRMASPEQGAAAFISEIQRLAGRPGGAREFGLAVLEASGIDAAEIGPETTLGDIGRVAVFRTKLECINRVLGLPWDQLKARVTAEHMPSSIIHTAIEQFRPDTAAWKGSDLGDSHLASLAAYAEITFVDKRTHEALRVARLKSSRLASILRRVEKAGDYAAIPDFLDEKA